MATDSDPVYYEWQIVEAQPGDGLAVIDECGDQHERYADARLCANINFAEYRPNRIAKIAVRESGELDLLHLSVFRPSKPRGFAEAIAWGRT